MISIENLSVAYGGFTLLDNISFHISENDKLCIQRERFICYFLLVRSESIA